MSSKKRKNLINRRFNRLFVLSLYKTIQYKKSKKDLYLCKCDCGNSIVTRGDSLLNGRTKSCGCFSKETIIKNNVKRKIPNGGAAINMLFNKYKEGAVVRNLEFTINMAFFKKITKQNCTYCGSKPSQIAKTKCSSYNYNGIDRQDNLLGYTKENCKPCCKICNRAKMDLSCTEFLKWIEQIKSMTSIKCFYLKRINDVSGTSGTGIVAIGGILPSGKCILEWTSSEITETIFESIDQIERIHGHGGKTLVIMGNPNEQEKPKAKTKSKTKAKAKK